MVPRPLTFPEAESSLLKILEKESIIKRMIGLKLLLVKIILLTVDVRFNETTRSLITSRERNNY